MKNNEQLKKFIEAQIEITTQLRAQMRTQVMKAEYLGEINAYKLVLVHLKNIEISQNNAKRGE